MRTISHFCLLIDHLAAFASNKIDLGDATSFASQTVQLLLLSEKQSNS